MSLLRLPRLRSRLGWTLLPSLFPLAFALLLWLVLGTGRVTLPQLLVVAVAVPAVALLAQRPGRALGALVVGLPFHLPLMGGLYALGLPPAASRAAGFWKELCAAAVIAAAWGSARRDGHRTDAVDAVAGAFSVLGTAYLLAPGLLVPDAAGAGLTWDVRLGGWRTLVLPVLLFLATRHLRLSSRMLSSLGGAVVAVGATLAAIATFEFLASAPWNRFVVDGLEVNRYRVDVLGQSLTSLDDIRAYGEVGDRRVVRVGGPMLSYLQLAFALLLPAALLIEGFVRGHRRRFGLLGMGLVGAALLFTQTRSAIVGALVMAVAALRPAPGRPERARVRYAIVGLGVMVLVGPLLIGSNLTERFLGGDVQSDVGHEQSLRDAWEVVREEPLGRGLATGSQAGAAEVQGAVTTENQLLDVGVQLGWAGMALWAALYVGVVRRLWAAAGATADPAIGSVLLGVRSAFVALLVACWFLTPFLTPEVAWVLFAMAGAALGSVDAGVVHDRDPVATHRSRTTQP